MINTNFKAAIDQLQASPIDCFSLALRVLENDNNGAVRYIEAGNPFVELMETAVVLYTNSLDRQTVCLTKQYPSNARNWDDLMRWMSDKDYEGMFSAPGQAPIMFFLDKEEIMNKAVLINDGSGDRKLTISRNSQIVSSGVKLTLLYPIDIIVTSFGTITVKYDIRNKNPLQNIPDLVIPSELRKSERSTYLYFEVPINQIEISSVTLPVTATQGLKRSIKFSDQFYYIRAFMRNDSDDVWTELVVKHNPNVLNNDKVTLAVKVDQLNQTVSVEIPQVYRNLNLIKENLRIDVYTTQGEISVPLFNISDNYFKAEWRDHEAIYPDKFSAPMATFNNYKIASDGYATGGTNGLTFQQVKDKVINRSTITEGIAISNNQINEKLSKAGFNLTQPLDNLSDREFLATRELTTPTTVSTTSLGSLTITHASTIEALTNNKYSTRNNDGQITTLPSTLFELVNGKLNLVSDDLMLSLVQQTKTNIDAVVNEINTRKFFYCPYFMIHKFAKDQYTVKPYRLDKPKIVTKSIEAENNLLGFSSNIVSYAIQVDKDYAGYSIMVQINPSDTLAELPIEDLKLQLRISDENERYFYWFNGELVTPLNPQTNKPMDNYYVYRFALPTNWEITDNEEILIGDFKIPFKLTGSADIFTIVRHSDLSQEYKTEMDQRINPRLFPDWTISNSLDYYSLIQEKVVINLGNHLKYLWRRYRPVPEETKYKKYEHDVLDVYKENVYEKDFWGNDLFDIVDGELVYRIKHRKGDPKYNEEGIQEVEFYAGDNILDEDKNPIPENGEYGIMRHYDIVLFDGKYYFTNHDKTKDYRESVKDELDAWLDQVKPFNEELLERTILYVHPRITEGTVKMLLDGGIESHLPSAQALSITFTVDERVANNTEITNDIKTSTVETIQKRFSREVTISLADIIQDLKDIMGDWIMGVTIDGFLGNKYETTTVLDSSISLSIPKRLAITTNLDIIVENDININFVTHTTITK